MYLLYIYIYIYSIHDRVHLWVLGFPHNKHGASGLTYEYDLNESGSPNFTSGLWWPKRIYIHRAYTRKIYLYIHTYVHFFLYLQIHIDENYMGATFPTAFFLLRLCRFSVVLKTSHRLLKNSESTQRAWNPKGWAAYRVRGTGLYAVARSKKWDFRLGYLRLMMIC